MNAPVCPVSRSQSTQNGGAPGTAPPSVLLPVIPIATDLPSLIRTVNVINDVLTSITTSLTVNNVWEPQAPIPNYNYLVSPYPTWTISRADASGGFVYYKSKDANGNKLIDSTQRALIGRINAIWYNNINFSDNPFIWRFYIPLDSVFGDQNNTPSFREDFFERVINVHWAPGLAVEFFDKES